MNAQYEAVYGRTRADMLNRHVREVIGQEAFDFAEPWIRKALAGIPVTFEAEEISPNLGRRDIEVSYFPDKEPDLPTRGYYILVQDITDRKRVEHALRNSELELRRALDVQSAAFDALPAHIALLDRRGKITWVNENWKQMAILNGLSDDTFGVGRDYLDVCGPVMGVTGEIAVMASKRIEDTLIGHATRIGHATSNSLDYPWHLPNQRRWNRLMINSVAQGGSTGIVVMHLDITVKREVDERIRQAERTRALGNLAGGIAHEINNLLAPIGLLTELTKSRLPRGSKGFQNLEKVLQANDRAAEIVQGMLAFGRKDESQKLPVELPSVVKEAAALLRTVLPVDIQLRQNIGHVSSQVIANATQIHQVIMNIALNAIDAMSPHTGTLTIGVHELAVREAVSTVSGELLPGRYAQIVMSDTGQGMKQEIVEHIFDPFYTTKEVGKGTGLGLSVVLGIVLTHGGGIQVSSKMDKGTTFRILLPLANIAATDISVAAQISPNQAINSFRLASGDS